jgi:MFS family permease
MTLTRPIVSAMMPGLVRTPDELTAGNVVSGWIESVGLLVGPATAGLLLAVSGPELVFGVSAGLSVIGVIAATTIRSQRTRERGPAEDRGHPLRGSFDGFLVAARDPSVRVLVVLGGATSILVGAVEVLCVVVAFALLHLGQGGPGMLMAASGAGGVIGGAATVLLIGRTRLSPPLLIGLIAFGAALMAVGLSPLPLALALLAVSGAGWSVADVAGRTLLQRISDDDVLARLFGVVEGIAMGAYAIGSIIASALVVWIGARGAVLAAGATMPVLGLLTWRRVHAADRSAHVPTAEIALLRTVRIFAALPAPVIERLAHAASTESVAAGTALVRQGDSGDRFYVIVDGMATVSIDGARAAELSRGAHFGEVALLRDVPRTATVSALTDLTVLVLQREPFLEAVTGHPQSLEAAHGAVDELIERNRT